MTETVDSKLVAEIEVGNGPIAFNTSMSDIITTEEEDESLIDDKTIDPSKEKEPEELKEDVVDKVPEEVVEEDLYKNHSEAALVGEALKKKRPDLFNDDIDKEIGWDNLIDKIDGYIATTLESGQNHVVDSMGQAKEYVEFLLSGGDPKTLEAALQNVQYSKIDVETSTDDEKEEVVRAMYKDIGLPGEEINNLVENIKLNDKLSEKAVQAIKKFDTKEKDILIAAKEQKRINDENAVNQRTQLTSSMNKIIEKGNVLGMNLNSEEQKELKEAFFNPTEIREISDGNGGTMTKRYTKYQILEAEFKNSLEKQIAFGKLLIDGFEFKKIKEQGKIERDQDILSVLDGRGGRRTSPNSRNTTNAYLTPVEEI